MLVSADQLLCHAVGDYILQSDWMALNKTKRWLPALAHAAAYALPFVALRPSLAALAVIVGTHAVVDRFRLARYVVWAKNWVAPGRPPSWSECSATGYPPDRPAWLTTWLLIIADNIVHVVVNGAALRWLP